MRFAPSTFEQSMTDPLIAVPQETVQTFDGKLGKSLTAKSAGRYPRGRVASTDETNGLDFVGALPILLAVRGAVWLDRLAAPRATAVDGVLENDPMVILTLSSEGSDRKYILWCEPAKDYHVRRIEYYASSGLRRRHDISYSHDEKSRLWIPVRWTRTSALPDGGIRVQKTSAVTYYSLGGAIPSEEFDLTFPPGTWVDDEVNNRSYIVLEDGGERVVTPAERAARLGYEELLERSPGLGSPRIWWIMSFSTIGLIVLLFFVWRSYRRRPAHGF
jgi:hypothetical protein